MVLDELKSEGVDVIISYLPVWEFCFSMHVLSEPDHHLYREKWVRKIEEKFPELVLRIREYSERTCQWTLFIDVPSWGEIRQLEIPDFLLFLRRQDICQWNRIIKPLERKISSQERKELLEIFRVYYEQVFQREELILRAYLVRILQREKEYCMRKGIWEWARTLHDRMRVEEDQIRYLKNRDFVYRKKDIHTIYLTASTFLEPHLWLYHHDGELEMVKSIRVERPESYHFPEQTILLFKALGDESRLNIVKLLFDGIKTTRDISDKLGLSEAAVSKHLKLLYKAKLVKKTPKGHYVEYELNMEVIDFIPYTLYEMLTRW